MMSQNPPNTPEGAPEASKATEEEKSLSIALMAFAAALWAGSLSALATILEKTDDVGDIVSTVAFIVMIACAHGSIYFPDTFVAEFSSYRRRNTQGFQANFMQYFIIFRHLTLLVDQLEAE